MKNRRLIQSDPTRQSSVAIRSRVVRKRLRWALCFVTLAFAWSRPAIAESESSDLTLSTEQITFGPKHHFFGYIGHVQNIPWNASGRYIVALQTDFHDHMPKPDEAADVVLIDTEQGNKVLSVDQSRAWNFQQGTMFYWNPKNPETQFFFNDRDPETGRVFCVLFDISKGQHGQRVREYRFEDTPVGNGGVAQNGGTFLGINYGRMDRLRPVTGYPGAFDWTVGVAHPRDDGIFKIDIATGEKTLLVSFHQLARTIRPIHPHVDQTPLFINHTLWNREDDRIYFYARGNFSKSGKERINVPFTIKPDGSGLTPLKTFIGGHPEWDYGHRVIGVLGDRQILYDVDRQLVVGTLGSSDIFPKPGADISLSPDGKWFVNGHMDREVGKNFYNIYCRSNGTHLRTAGFSTGQYQRGELRIDPAPRWNRTSDAILVPCWTDEGTRQMFIIRIQPASKREPAD